MYKVNYYKEEKPKDSTYDYALYNCLNNENKKWDNYYAYLKDKYDLCYNVESITIDVNDIKNMRYECFSNGILLKLYTLCKSHLSLNKYQRITIPNNNIFSEELIYNIFRTDWLINEELLEKDPDELAKRKHYFATIIHVSEDIQDIKIQFRNKLYSYFLEALERIKNEDVIEENNDKVLKLEKID